MAIKNESPVTYKYTIKVPESDPIKLEYSSELTVITWPTANGPIETLHKLRRAMHIGADVVERFGENGDTFPSVRLSALMNQRPNEHAHTTMVSIYDKQTGYRLVWERLGQQRLHESGISGLGFNEERLRAVFQATGEIALISNMDYCVEEVLDLIN
jgi:hypothetical protein